MRRMGTTGSLMRRGLAGWLALLLVTVGAVVPAAADTEEDGNGPAVLP